MKQIVAVVQPYCAQAVLEAVSALSPEAVTVRESKGFRMRPFDPGDAPGREYDRIYLPKIEISFLADENVCETMMQRIVETARTGRLGDGKIFCFPVEAEFDF